MAVDRVGQDGSITIEEARSIDTSIDIEEGFKLSAGFCAGAFITDERRSMMFHNEPLILVTDHKIDAVDSILPILEMIARESRPLIIVAEDIEGQALAALIMNAVRGTLKIAGIKAPFYGNERRELLEDLAASVGATFVSRESGVKLKDTQLKDLGSAKFIESSKHSTTIVGGSADYEEIDKRIEALKNDVVNSEDMAEAEMIQRRVARLASGVAVIRVGGTTEVEVTERKHRIEDALEAVRSAQEEGIIPGGGAGLLRASQTITIVTRGTKPIDPDQFIGIDVVRKACLAPIRQMAANSGESADIIINEILKSDEKYGWDFKNNRLSDMIKEGIIDPVKVTKTALQNAASCAGTLLTTNFGIIQTEDK
jgi:chaperonin GroEL